MGTGAVNVSSQGYGPWTSGNVTLSYSGSLTEYENLVNNAAALQAAINNGNAGGTDTGLPTEATFTISSFSQKTCTFKGYVNKANLNVTDWTNGGALRLWFLRRPPRLANLRRWGDFHLRRQGNELRRGYLLRAGKPS